MDAGVPCPLRHVICRQGDTGHMSLLSGDEERLSHLIAKLKPEMDKTLGPTVVKAIPDDPMMSRPVIGGKPVLPNLTSLTVEEKKNFSLSVAAQYLNEFVFSIKQVNEACLNGEFDIAAGIADYVWVAYPDLAPYLDSEAPSVAISKRQGDYVNFPWQKYTDEVDNAIMMSSQRKFLVTDEKVAELKATRDRRIAREYLIFNFVQKAVRGAGDMGWLAVIDARFDTTDVQAMAEEEAANEG